MSLPDCAELETWLAERESAVPQLRADCAKRIAWAGDAGARRAVSVVYIHGFSATRHEISPVPEEVAARLGANLFSTRLTGHGQDSAAMGRATLAEWQADTAEAIAVGHALGDAVVLMGCSTGCTLITLALAGGAQAAAAVMVSPNYGLRHRLAQGLLDMPGVRRWGPLLVGRERRFEVISEDHARWWTVRYPTQAVFTMADTVRAVRRADLSRITTPAFFNFCEADQVVSPAATRGVMQRWGAEVAHREAVVGAGDDKMGHVIAGDVFSPAQTAGTVQAIAEWLAPRV